MKSASPDNDPGREALSPIVPDWPAPANVRAYATTRVGGVSRAPFHSLNLSFSSGDDPKCVERNRARVAEALGLPEAPRWLKQVHGTRVVEADAASSRPEADAAFAMRPGPTLAVTTADCIPVLFCHRGGAQVAAAHAGWRGLAAGVLESTLAALQSDPADLMAWLGPGIGAQAFEVGPEVRDAFVEQDPGAAEAFLPGRGDRLMADLYGLVRRRLERAGVDRVFGGDHCTYSEPERFFSYRRDGARSGRMGTFIWLED